MDVNDKKAKIRRIVEITRDSEISSIKQTVSQLLNIINDPNSSAKDLTDIIEIDPPMSAKLLKLANSAYYGYRKKINAIKEAIICIGFETVKELALNQKVCEMFNNDTDYYGYSRTSLWKHSIAVALLSKSIYRSEFRERGENIYVAGLLHEIGIIILDQFQQYDFINTLKKSKNDKINLADSEDAVFGFNHSDIGMAVVEDWGLSDEIVVAIGNHCKPDNFGNEFKKIVMTIYLSDYVTQNRNIGYVDAPYRDKMLFQRCLMKLNIKEKAVELIMEEVVKELNKMEKAGWF